MGMVLDQPREGHAGSSASFSWAVLVSQKAISLGDYLTSLKAKTTANEHYHPLAELRGQVCCSGLARSE